MANGCNARALGPCSHAEGVNTRTTATAGAAHVEGSTNITTAPASHTEGILSAARGIAAHSEGFQTEARADFAHAEGSLTKARGAAAHAEGRLTEASGLVSHSEGDSTKASGTAAHAEGFQTEASGDNSHAGGENTKTAGFRNAHILGRFGDVDEANSWFIGNGIAAAARGVGAKWSGSTFDMEIQGAYLNPQADYAELFETADGNPIDAGYFVTAAAEDKIRKATADDRFILGITSATPSLLGNSAGLCWQEKFLTDEWGRKKYHQVTIPAQKDKEGNVISPERTEIQPMLNPEWNYNKEYIPRIDRPEWAAVGLLGQILVRDDGTCEVHGYCRPNDVGIATKAESGYFVLKRTGPNQVLVLFR